MKIVHVINSMIIGGAEKLLHDTIIEFNKKGYKQHLITLYGKGVLLNSINSIVEHLDLNANNYNFYFRAKKLKKYLQQINPDVVHAHLYDATIMARLAIVNKEKLAYTYHNGIYNPTSVDFSSKRLWLDKATYSKKHKVIFVSNSVKNEIENKLKIKGESRVIYNFASRDFDNQYQLKPTSSLKIISIGNLRMQKNHEFSIKAINELNNENIILDIYGSGNKEVEIKNLVSNTNVKVNIKKNTPISSQLLNEYDLFLMPSTQEGMSIALIEAMKSGLPCLLSNIPSFRETAKDAAIYFSIHNTKELKEKLLFLLNNKGVLYDMSKKSVETASEYAIEKHIEELIKFYTN